MVRQFEIKKRQYEILFNLIKDKKIKYKTLKLDIKKSNVVEVGIFTIHNLTTQNKYIMTISNKDRMKLIKKLKQLNITIK
jgi:hypothetical protein|tara:strand:+ start:68 stop:307 length:240 start_codon:yes stop_codon:yes gene_type:complete